MHVVFQSRGDCQGAKQGHRSTHLQNWGPQIACTSTSISKRVVSSPVRILTHYQPADTRGGCILRGHASPLSQPATIGAARRQIGFASQYSPRCNLAHPDVAVMPVRLQQCDRCDHRRHNQHFRQGVRQHFLHDLFWLRGQAVVGNQCPRLFLGCRMAS
jgi:hypothetical protein